MADQKDDGDNDGGLETEEDDLTLVSCDDDNPENFKLARKAAMMCNLVRSIIEGDNDVKKIEIKKVSKDILKLIVQYLKHHMGKVPAEIAKPIRSVKMEKIVEDEWDADFINKQAKRVIFQIILGANYMDIKSLLHLGCAKIATMIKGKSPEEIKKILSEDDPNEPAGDDQKADK